MALGFLKKEMSVKRVFFSQQKYTTLSNNQDIIVPVHPLTNGLYMRHCKAPSPSLSVFKMDCNGDLLCAKVNSIFPNGLLQIFWCESTPDRILLHANNAMWGEFACGEDKMYTFTEWDDIIVPCLTNKFSSCGRCSLVMTISRSIRDYKWLDCEFIELRKNPMRKVYHYKVVKECPYNLDKHDHRSKVIKLCLYSGGECDDHNCGVPVCSEHFLLIQVSQWIFRYKVRRVEELGEVMYTFSDPVNIMCIVHSQLYPPTIHGSFTMSQDRQLVALLTSHHLCDITFHMWNLESGVYTRRELELQSDTILSLELLAVGSLYSVFVVVTSGTLKKVVIFQTESGRIIVKDEQAATVSYCCNEDWMSSFETLEEPRIGCLN